MTREESQLAWLRIAVGLDPECMRLNGAAASETHQREVGKGSCIGEFVEITQRGWKKLGSRQLWYPKG